MLHAECRVPGRALRSDARRLCGRSSRAARGGRGGLLTACAAARGERTTRESRETRAPGARQGAMRIRMGLIRDRS